MYYLSFQVHRSLSKIATSNKIEADGEIILLQPESFYTLRNKPR